MSRIHQCCGGGHDRPRRREADHRESGRHRLRRRAGAALNRRTTVPGVRFIPLLPAPPDDLGRLPLAAARLRGSGEPSRAAMIETPKSNLALYSREA